MVGYVISFVVDSSVIPASSLNELARDHTERESSGGLGAELHAEMQADTHGGRMPTDAHGGRSPLCQTVQKRILNFLQVFKDIFLARECFFARKRPPS